MAYEKLSPKQKDRLERGVCLSCGDPSGGKKLCPPHMKRQSVNSKRFAVDLRREIFDHYGNECSCCGETTPEFLTIDHINSNVTREPCGTALYLRIRREGFPDEFRILCWNCNCGRRRGACPHELLRKKALDTPTQAQ